MEHNKHASFYDPLDRAKPLIRLVHLQPRSAGDEISCSLRVASLEDKECIYEALSYEWGDADGSLRSIMLDGQPFSVRVNLWAALWHLRNDTTTRILWIDALAINQADDLERGHQVHLMGNIYKHSSQVIAWVGLPEAARSSSSQSESDFELMTELVQLLVGDRSKKATTAYIGGIESDAHTGSYQTEYEEADVETSLTLEEAEDDRFLYLAELCLRSYWQRLWIIQELVLAPRIIIQCGIFYLEWEKMWRLHLRLISSYSSFLDSELVDHFYNSKLVQIMNTRISAKRTDEQKRHANLFELFSDYMFADCSDPRDHVFGLLGLCSKCCRDDFVADYSDSTALICEKLLTHYTLNHESYNHHDYFSPAIRMFVTSPSLDWSPEPNEYAVLRHARTSTAPFAINLFFYGHISSIFPTKIRHGRPNAQIEEAGTGFVTVTGYEGKALGNIRVGDAVYTLESESRSIDAGFILDPNPQENESLGQGAIMSVSKCIFATTAQAEIVHSVNDQNFFMDFESLRRVYEGVRWVRFGQ